MDEIHLTFLATSMANIEKSHPGATELVERGAISVARSFIPGCRNSVDKHVIGKHKDNRPSEIQKKQFH